MDINVKCYFSNPNVWNWSLLCKPASATANKHALGHQAMVNVKKKEEEKKERKKEAIVSFSNDHFRQ